MPRTTASEATAQYVGTRIRAARTAAGITQVELARRLEVSPSYITNVEAGRNNLTLGQLTHIADALGAALDVSLTVVDERPPAPRRDFAAA
jgi:transcriptional regulator with XRE-family HTH domain